MSYDPRLIAGSAAADLMRSIVEQDTCTREGLRDWRAETVDRHFRRLAEALGYEVSVKREDAA